MTLPTSRDAAAEPLPLHLRETRTSYDTVAAAYAEVVCPAFARDVLGRAMLAAFAELVRADGGAPVVDAGCGPGQVTAFLHSLGLDASGVDLSPGMVELARRDHPGLRFDVGTMAALERADGSLGGVLAWYSVIHTPPELLPPVFAEFHRVLAPGGHLLLGFHVGDERRRKEEGYGGLPMSLDLHLLPPDRITELATGAGLSTQARLIRKPVVPGRAPQAALLFRKPPARPVAGPLGAEAAA
ncbi:class I SAM-dependent methyltransferase [Streptacidiphilus sp. PB12-B1b]|uniref:class I SAM-dependent DNA methyltransferase n=1 Tax=Streptacidiphilus sp. PB12-B1b TaxID=2705012 RepID=UPI0015FD39E9|nr:class I SAM-dependent methyltransferase [Streptacidiphilus sp. PB12-B1b]QMU79689.1 class I SAM-dependent methyltransferase [Streptacidiphilus sp. PB12-B1b]